MTRIRAHILVVTVAAALFAVSLAVVPASDVGAQANPYQRSSNVETGKFFNPNGVLYGYLGDFTDQGGGTSGSYAQVSYHESQTGQNVSIVHVFSGAWNNNFNATFGNKLATLAPSAAAGKVPMYSLGNPNLAHMNALLADDPGEIAKVRAWATQYRNSGIGPMFARLAHEADRPDRAWSGNPALFIRWWHKFVDVVETDAAGYTAPDTLIWLFSPTSWGYWHDDNNAQVAPMASRAAALYPGDAYVDWIGSSGYDYPCAYASSDVHRKTHEEVLEPALSWASQAAPSKPFMLAEWGSENTVGPNNLENRADFFATTDDMLRSNLPGFDQIGGIVYFDRHHNEVTGPNGVPAGCNWLLHDPAPAFPNPNAAYNQGANAAVSVTNASDFAGYQSLVNTPGLFVPLGVYQPDPNPPGPDASCAVEAIQDFVEVSWEGLEGEDVNVRRDDAWIYENGADDAITTYTDTEVVAGDESSYVVRYWSGGESTDVACGSVSLPVCSVDLVDDVPTVSWEDLNRTPQLRINDVWRTTITDLDSGSYADQQIEAGATYSYVIRINYQGNAVDLPCGSAQVPWPTPPSTSLCNGLTVTWDMNTNGGDGYATPGDDVILGTPGDDVIIARGGNDIVCAGGGDDFVRGGPGDDQIEGGPGIDELLGDGGNDLVYGGDDDDVLVGGPDIDFLFGQGGMDLLKGSNGADQLDGGADDDQLYGQNGNDGLAGGPGNDTLRGAAGDDVLSGNDGDDQVYGSWGDDTLFGGNGNDIMRGNQGNDTLHGGAGDDFLSGGDEDDTNYGGAGFVDKCYGNGGTSDASQAATCEQIFSSESTF